MSREQLLSQLSDFLSDKFQVPAEKIAGPATLREDLDLDSIDMFDLFLLFEKETGKIIHPEEFRSVKTVEDLVVTLERVLNLNS